MQTRVDQLPALRSSIAPLAYSLCGLSFLTFLALLHHPVSHGGQAPAILASIRAQTAMDQRVHGALALVFSLCTAAMFLFAFRLGVDRVLVMVGVVAFSCAIIFWRSQR